jgi:hypothetical protein
MNQSRREFAGSVAALGILAAAGAPPALAQANHAVRVPLSEFSRDAVRVASLRKGVAVMKGRPPSDHRSWFFQAAIHAYNDALYADALARDPDMSKVNRARYWNKCTHFGQSSANFLIWHRAYLYYFERILRDAAGDPSLALPYWDYASPESRAFPQIFAPKFLDADNTPNPLFHANRELAFVVGTLALSGDIGEAQLARQCETFFSDIGLTGFGGDILDSKHTALGLLEQRPHNDIHLAVGGVVGGNNGAMADVKTAAFDPVFFVHHANIDRMWTQWSCAAGKQWGALPPAEWFEEQPWIFLDVDGSEQCWSRRFYMDRSNLDVRYDFDGAGAVPLAVPFAPVMGAPPETATAPGAAGATESEMPQMMMAPPPPPPKAKQTQPHERQLFVDKVPLVVSPSYAINRELGEQTVGAIRRTKRAKRREPGAEAAKPTLMGLAQPPAPGERIQLELQDIKFDRVPSSGFAVYLASASDAEQDSRGTLVGLLDLFGATHMQMPGMTATQRFDVTRIVSTSPGPYTLHVEPYSLLENRNGGSTKARPDMVHIGSVRFVVLS